MWKFKTTKYKNSAPKLPKKEEWITNLPIGNLMQSAGNHIGASCTYIAFNTGGGHLGIVPLTASGRQHNVPQIYGHGDFVSDFQFSPVNDGLLATGSFDCTVKLWSLGEEVTEHVSNAASTLSHFNNRIENVVWNPVVEGILAVSSGPSVDVFDVEKNAQVFSLGGHEDMIHGFSWKQDGSMIVTTCKDKQIRVFDPRAASPLVQQGLGHDNIRDSRVSWLGTTDQFISSGFNASRGREVNLWNFNNLKEPVTSREIDSSGTGVLLPFFDPDSKMLFLVGKGDTSMRFCEVTENSPFLTEGAADNLMQMKGVCLIPKRAVDVMKGEVNRCLLLCRDSIIPCPYIVPRKTYHDFHADIFPDTFSGEAAMMADEWLSGQNKPSTTVSLNPAQAANKLKPSKPFMVQNGAAPAVATPAPAPPSNDDKASGEPQEHLMKPSQYHFTESPSVEPPRQQIQQVAPPVVHQSVPEETPMESSPHVAATQPTSLNISLSSTQVDHDATPRISTLTIGSPEAHKNDQQQTQKSFGRVRSYSTEEEPKLQPQPSPPKPAASGNISVVTREKKRPVFTAVRASKFRHLKGSPMHKNTFIENVRNLSNSTPGECDMFHVNKVRCAVPLKGAGGLIGVYELNKPGRLPDADLPYIQNGSTVYDFMWDPFDACRLMTCCEDGSIRIWKLPEGGLTETMTQPVITLRGHTERIYFAKFHPLAKDVLVSASHDLQIIVWNLDLAIPHITCTGHTDAIFCLAWSVDGSKFATACKDNKIRIYDPRKSTEPIQEGEGPGGTRGARIVWTLEDKYLVVSGFDRQRNRMLVVYNPEDLSAPLSSIDINISPSILIPFYDEDSSTIFLTGRGESTAFAYEIAEEDPHLFALSSYRNDSQYQAYSFLPKSEVDVKQIEFAKAYRLTHTTVEPVSFTVPRVKANFFQDDIFPPTKVTWHPIMDAADWFSGSNKLPQRISLKPKDMHNLHDAPVEGPRASKYDSYNPETYKTDDEKKEELIGAMMDKLEDQTDKPLPQELTEGVDEDEWDD